MSDARPIEVVCFGGIASDVRARALDRVQLECSNPVRTSRTAGGVARNIAECLARLDVAVSIVSRVGMDRAGNEVLAELESLGVDTSHVGRSADQSTAAYTALLDRHGNLVIGMSEMAIFDELTPETVPVPGAKSVQAWLLDTNLPEATLTYLASHPARPKLVAANTVSIVKARRLVPILAEIDILFCNNEELDIIDASIPKTTVVTRGDEGAIIQRGDRLSTVPAKFVSAVDVTGAGDCLAGATLWATLQGKPITDAVRTGHAAAALSLRSERAVPETLTTTLLAERSSNRSRKE